MSGDGWSGTFSIEGRPEEAGGAGGTQPHAELSASLPGYFATMGIPLLAGRDLTDRDDLAAPLAVVIDENLARRYWPGESAIGKRLSTQGSTGPWATVVGVVAHVRRAGPRNDGEPQIYFPVLQRPQPAMYYVARVTSPSSFAAAAGDAVRRVDRSLVPARFRPMGALEASAVTRERFNLVVFSAFGLVGLLVASIGVFGVMAYLVAQRRQEMAVRAALGSGQRALITLVTREALSLTTAGLALGLVGSVVASRLLASLLFGIPALDPVTYIAISLLLVSVTTLAAFGPAVRAARTDPAIALRS
jgi:putative ABC transport system permease protein